MLRKEKKPKDEGDNGDDLWMNNSWL